MLRPSTRGLVVSASAEEGVMIPGLHKETAKDEMSMRKLFNDACENRACHSLPVGGSIHTSCAVWEVNLSQSEGVDDGHSTRKCHSRLIVLDLPVVDSLVRTSESQPLESLTLHRSLVSFMDVVQRLSSPSRAALAPFRTSKLTHYLSELLGGNAIVVGLGMIAGNEAAQSKKTMGIVSALGDSVHFPVGGRELTDVLSGLLGKYRAMILQLQDEIENGAPVGEQGMDNLFKPLDLGLIADHQLAQQFAVNRVINHRRRKGVAQMLDPGATFGIELVNLGIRVIDRNPERFKHTGNRGFSHTDGAGQADMNHRHFCVNPCKTWWRSAASTPGVTPNQAANPAFA